MEEIEKDLNQMVADRFNRAYGSAPVQLLLTDTDKVKILAPEYAIKRLEEHYLTMVDRGPASTRKFCGLKLECGYENAIIIYHEDAPLFS